MPSFVFMKFIFNASYHVKYVCVLKQLCHSVAATVAVESKQGVLYIDTTGGFSGQRLNEILDQKGCTRLVSLILWRLLNYKKWNIMWGNGGLTLIRNSIWLVSACSLARKWTFLPTVIKILYWILPSISLYQLGKARGGEWVGGLLRDA